MDNVTLPERMKSSINNDALPLEDSAAHRQMRPAGIPGGYKWTTGYRPWLRHTVTPLEMQAVYESNR